MLIQFCSLRSDDFMMFFLSVLNPVCLFQTMFEIVNLLNFRCLAKNIVVNPLLKQIGCYTTPLKFLWLCSFYICSLLKHFQDKFGRMLSAVPIELTKSWNQFWGSILFSCTFVFTRYFFNLNSIRVLFFHKQDSKESSPRSLERLLLRLKILLRLKYSFKSLSTIWWNSLTCLNLFRSDQ